ncbi:MAG: CdaR family transcriptional regulator [Candidatus Epulonipiscioides saccharophilum]|nr:CdaR family transcriptional regulator [Epulopiscium sp. SCG-B10WGA-EpuloB]OON96949.1 MAG: CdaR family transcriptional regulator [Epulopiscium sp. AS2M-Bin001]
MITNQVLQNIVDGLKMITRRDICILDAEAKVVATTGESLLGEYKEEVSSFITSAADSQEMLGSFYVKVFDEYIVEYIVAIKGGDDEAYKLGKMTAFQIKNLLVAYKERFDKDNFIKNLLLDNLLLVDIYNRAKKLHVENSVPRVVYLIENVDVGEVSITETVRSLFPDKNLDFVTAVDDKSIILVKTLDSKSEEEVQEHADMIYNTLLSEALIQVAIGVGTVVYDLKDVSNSYKEAAMSLEVGKIFNYEAKISTYSKLGVGRIIYQLPVTLCRMFIDEVLKGKKITHFDEETLSTVNKFFENSLNVSETSRQLYIHRNTLVYRLDKLLKMTGLDLREFDDAIVFKITIMVSQYMDYMEKQSMPKI